MIAEGFPFTCDLCRDPIVGPRICCINCPSVNLCVRCSMRPGDHSFDGASSKGHSMSHICRVIMRSDA
jgi:hypothetical protein